MLSSPFAPGQRRGICSQTQAAKKDSGLSSAVLQPAA